MSKFLKAFFVLILIGTISQAQPYKLAAGLRLGSPLSASVKYFVKEKNSLEAFLGHRRYSSSAFASWTMIGAAYTWYNPLKDIDEGLGWYAGGGASAFFWSYDYSGKFAGNPSYSKTSGGLLGQIGVDYKFKELPLNLSVDWMPIIFISGYGSGFGGGYGALSARYVFN